MPIPWHSLPLQLAHFQIYLNWSSSLKLPWSKWGCILNSKVGLSFIAEDKCIVNEKEMGYHHLCLILLIVKPFKHPLDTAFANILLMPQPPQTITRKGISLTLATIAIEKPLGVPFTKIRNLNVEIQKCYTIPLFSPKATSL